MAHKIVFAQQKGGAGKTTALSLYAAIAAEAGRRVAVVDLDPQRTAAAWANLRAARAKSQPVYLVESSDWRAGSDMDRAAREADVVLVDLPGAADSALNRALRAADLVIAPAQPSAPDLWALDKTVAAARREKVELRVLLNRAPPVGSAADDARAVLTEMEVQALKAQLGARVGIARAFAAGAGVTETEPRSRAAEEARAFAAEIDALLAHR